MKKQHKKTRQQLADYLRVDVNELDDLVRVRVTEGKEEIDVNVQACLRECSDFVNKRI